MEGIDEVVEGLERVITLLAQPEEGQLIIKNEEKTLNVRAMFRPNGCIHLNADVRFSGREHSLKLDGIPVLAERSCIAQLMQAFRTTKFIRDTLPTFDYAEKLNEACYTVGRVIGSLKEGSIRQCEIISNYLTPPSLANELVVFCGPVGDSLVFTCVAVRPSTESGSNGNLIDITGKIGAETHFQLGGKEFVALDSVSGRVRVKGLATIQAQLQTIRQLLSVLALDYSGRCNLEQK